MMRRLREIPCRMLPRTAVQPRVLVALIQCATMATQVVEVATESEEDVIIKSHCQRKPGGAKRLGSADFLYFFQHLKPS